MSSRTSRTAPNQPRAVRNELLAALPNDDRDRIVRAMEVVPLTLKEIVQKVDDPVEYVYFPGGGFLSVVAVLEDGRMVEVTTVGSEGAAGVSAALDDARADAATIVQGETDVCYRMTAKAFRHEMDRRGAFYELLTRYTHAFVGVIMQSTACNAVHSIEQRLARWLLLAQDRMAAEQFPLTQEFVAMMLGANRSTVTVVAGTLQKAGLITYRRGRVSILQRDKLESASCECYRAATNLLQSVTADGSRRSRPR